MTTTITVKYADGNNKSRVVYARDSREFSEVVSKIMLEPNVIGFSRQSTDRGPAYWTR